MESFLADTKWPQILAQTILPAILLINIDLENKIFYEKTKFKQYSSTNPNPTPQKILEEKLQHNDKKLHPKQHQK